MTFNETNRTTYGERAAQVRANGGIYYWTGERDAAKHGGAGAPKPISAEALKSIMADIDRMEAATPEQVHAEVAAKKKGRHVLDATVLTAEN